MVDYQLPRLVVAPRGQLRKGRYVTPMKLEYSLKSEKPCNGFKPVAGEKQVPAGPLAEVEHRDFNQPAEVDLMEGRAREQKGDVETWAVPGHEFAAVLQLIAEPFEHPPLLLKSIRKPDIWFLSLQQADRHDYASIGFHGACLYVQICYRYVIPP